MSPARCPTCGQVLPVGARADAGAYPDPAPQRPAAARATPEASTPQGPGRTAFAPTWATRPASPTPDAAGLLR